MSKKVIGLIVVLIALVMVAPLGAKGPGGGEKGQTLATLTDAEIYHLTYMREEEKLARDVYLTLSEEHSAAIFVNISQSEQRHMDALKRLIVKYGLQDPVVNEVVGEFTNEDFSDLYGEFVDRGIKSYCAALRVGVDIEVLDIEDIELALDDVEAKDVTRVLNNLLSGSYNHLNAFTTSLTVAPDCQ
jgi:hypothetical protein